MIFTTTTLEEMASEDELSPSFYVDSWSTTLYTREVGGYYGN